MVKRVLNLIESDWVEKGKKKVNHDVAFATL